MCQLPPGAAQAAMPPLPSLTARPGGAAAQRGAPVEQPLHCPASTGAEAGRARSRSLLPPGRARTGKVAGRNLSYAPIPPWGSGRPLPQRVSEAQSAPPRFPSTEMRRAPSPLLPAPPLTLPGLNWESRRARWARGAAAPLCPDSAPAGDSRSASFLSSPLPPRPPSPATAPGGPRRRSGSGAVSRHFPQRRAAPIAPAAAAAAGAPGGETQLLLAPSPCPTYRPAGEGAHTRGSAAGASGHPGSAVLSPGLLCPAAAGTQVVVRS